MLSQWFHIRFIKQVIFSKHLKIPNSAVTIRLSHQLADPSNGVSYPPIIDMSPEGQNRHQRQMWYDSIKALPTVEEKLHEIAICQELELTKTSITSVPDTYNATFFYPYVTRTHLIEGLPDKLNRMKVDNELSEIRNVFNEALLSHYSDMWQSNKSRTLSDFLNERDAGSKLVKNLVSKCYLKMALRNEYLMESTIHQSPRLCSYWWHARSYSEKDKLQITNPCFQFQDHPSFIIRMKNPLSPILSMDDPVCSTADVPDFNFDACTLGIPKNEDHLTSIPGYWPGDPNEFPLLLVYTSDKLQSLLERIEKYNLSKIEDSVGIMASFGLLNAVSTYQGFSPYHELTYPLVTQTILTNGQDWNFFVYQLNTVSFHKDIDMKDRRNICWSSGKLRLFETIEDGQIKGINDDVYKLLLKFLLNAPEVREGLVLKPYLGVDQRTEEEAQNMRYFLRKMMSHAPEFDAHKSEVPTWVKIYKLHPDAPPCPYVKLE